VELHQLWALVEPLVYEVTEQRLAQLVSPHSILLYISTIKYFSFQQNSVKWYSKLFQPKFMPPQINLFFRSNNEFFMKRG
jgi:hypothetical protein